MCDLLSLSFSKKHEKSVAQPEQSGNAGRNPSSLLPFYTVNLNLKQLYLFLLVCIIPKKTNIIALNSNKKKKEENDHWLKFEIWTLKIYIRIIKHYTDIDPTVDIKTQVNRNFTTSTFLFLGYLDEP